jgi:hypothetical protein
MGVVVTQLQAVYQLYPSDLTVNTSPQYLIGKTAYINTDSSSSYARRAQYYILGI